MQIIFDELDGTLNKCGLFKNCLALHVVYTVGGNQMQITLLPPGPDLHRITQRRKAHMIWQHLFKK